MQSIDTAFLKQPVSYNNSKISYSVIFKFGNYTLEIVGPLPAKDLYH